MSEPGGGGLPLRPSRLHHIQRSVRHGKALPGEPLYLQADSHHQEDGPSQGGGALFDSLNVTENILFPIRQHCQITDFRQAEELVKAKLAMVGLDGFQNYYPANLSGGQRKRVALARAIALNPEVILYDEPTTGLDPIRADVINELILKLQNDVQDPLYTEKISYFNAKLESLKKLIPLVERQISLHGSTYNCVEDGYKLLMWDLNYPTFSAISRMEQINRFWKEINKTQKVSTLRIVEIFFGPLVALFIGLIGFKKYRKS